MASRRSSAHSFHVRGEPPERRDDSRPNRRQGTACGCAQRVDRRRQPRRTSHKCSVAKPSPFTFACWSSPHRHIHFEEMSRSGSRHYRRMSGSDRNLDLRLDQGDPPAYCRKSDRSPNCDRSEDSSLAMAFTENAVDRVLQQHCSPLARHANECPVHNATHEQCHARQVEPHQQHHDAAERAVGFVHPREMLDIDIDADGQRNPRE